MKISYNWLKDYLDIHLSPDKLSELLTDCGLEVEGLEEWQSVKGGLEGFVIGEVKSCEKHPDADRLSVTTVDVGSGELLPIVCGAPNVAAGQKVVVATVGATIYHGDESFEIKKVKLRGQASEGMICAEDEIGLGTSHDGILVLDSHAKVGMPASEFFNIESDYIFEIGLTPNRTDAMSHIGVARDIKAVLDNIDFIAGKKPDRNLTLPSTSLFNTENSQLDIPVIIENPEACPRYAGVTISGIKVKESPDWLKNRLNAIGLRPINNIVDITNYVLHETGQPLHAFDAAEITGNKVIVRKMAEGTPFITLDEVERKLTSNDLMICNTKEGMCIGGVFGGIKSGVTEKTKNIFLESAYFDPVHIRKTSKHHDLQTDASFRFERGVDPDMTLYALKRAGLLIKELAGGSISSEIKDVYPLPVEKVKLDVSWKNIDRLIGKVIGKEVIKNILHSLEFDILNESDNGLTLLVPSCRVDVTREADVIEEILRIYGYNNIEIPLGLNSSVSRTAKPDAEKIQQVVSDLLTNIGFSEVINNSLTKSSYYENQKDFSANNSVNILNPLSRDLGVMRQTLLFGGLESVIYNMNRKNSNLKFYEFGKVYWQNQNTTKKDPVIKRFSEQNILALFITGNKESETWFVAESQVDFHYLKGICQRIINRLGIDVRNLIFKESDAGYFEFGLSYINNNMSLLEIGRVSNSYLNEFDIKEPVFYASFNWDHLLKLTGINKIGFTAIPKFPEVRRDLALLIDKNVKFEEVEKIAYETESKLLKSVNLFDIYEGKNIDPDKKSYAVSFILLDEEKTLTDKVIDKTMDKLMKAYINQLNASIR
ncbi:MAG: phenylalanine--tRNA ligase subunit beta [Bacteroidales bacterium]